MSFSERGIQVEVTQCSRPEYWYKDLVGEKFTVIDRGSDFVLVEDYITGDVWRHIEKKDCKTIKQGGRDE